MGFPAFERKDDRLGHRAKHRKCALHTMLQRDPHAELGKSIVLILLSRDRKGNRLPSLDCLVSDLDESASIPSAKSFASISLITNKLTTCRAAELTSDSEGFFLHNALRVSHGRVPHFIRLPHAVDWMRMSGSRCHHTPGSSRKRTWSA